MKSNGVEGELSTLVKTEEDSSKQIGNMCYKSRRREALSKGEFKLVRQHVGHHPNEYVLVLTKAQDNETFLGRLCNDPKKAREAERIVSASARLARNGTGWAIESGTLKLLEGDLAIYELKSKATVYRVMTYVHNDRKRTPVLLFSFHGHRSKRGGGILRSDLARARRFAAIAKSLMEMEFEND